MTIKLTDRAATHAKSTWEMKKDPSFYAWELQQLDVQVICIKYQPQILRVKMILN